MVAAYPQGHCEFGNVTKERDEARTALERLSVAYREDTGKLQAECERLQRVLGDWARLECAAEERDRYRAALERIANRERQCGCNGDAREALTTSEVLVNTKISNNNEQEENT